MNEQELNKKLAEFLKAHTDRWNMGKGELLVCYECKSVVVIREEEYLEICKEVGIMMQQELNRLDKKFAEWAGFTNYGDTDWRRPDGMLAGGTGLCPDFTQSLDACFKWLVPKSRMDTLWIINNLDSPTPKLEYCFGITRGEGNDLICWDKEIPIEDCLSPIVDTPALALCLAIEKLIDSGGKK